MKWHRCTFVAYRNPDAAGPRLALATRNGQWWRGFDWNDLTLVCLARIAIVVVTAAKKLEIVDATVASLLGLVVSIFHPFLWESPQLPPFISALRKVKSIAIYQGGLRLLIFRWFIVSSQTTDLSDGIRTGVLIS